MSATEDRVPELPEIETLRRGLLPLLTGRQIRGVVVRERRLREPVAIAPLRRLRGSRVIGVRRRSKYLLLDTDAGLTLLIHLGMSGRLWVADSGRARRPHEHVVIALDDGHELRFADARRFGLLRVVRSDRLDRDRRLARLGPDPLNGGLASETLFRGTRGRRKPVKNFLMDTSAIAGIGNIYACEALFRARLNPRRQVRYVGRESWKRLLASLREVLDEAIRAGGTTLRDFRNAGEDAGSFAVALRVYGHAGAPCRVCRTPIRRVLQAGRSTFYCPRCQR